MPGIVPLTGIDELTGMPVPMYEPYSTARNKHQKAIDDAGDKERIQRTADIEKRRKYYDGQHDLPLKVMPGEPDKNILVNVYGTSIDRLVKFCRVPKLEVEDGYEEVRNEMGITTKEPNAVQQALNTLLKTSSIADLVPNTLESGSLAGHKFYRIVLPEDGEPSIENPPTLELIDPKYMTVFWHQATRKLLWYRMTWSFGEEVMRQDIVPVAMVTDDVLQQAQNRPDVGVEGWVIIEQKKKARSAGFDVVAVDVWDYPFPPIIDGKLTRRAHEYYGRALIKSFRLQDGINFVASNTGKIIEIHAHPKMMIFGDQLGDEVDMRVDGILDGLDAEARAQQLEMTSDLSSSINFYNVIREAFFNEVGATDPSAVKDKIGAATNFVMRMLFGDQIETTEELRRQQSKMLSEAFRRLLYIIGIEDAVVNVVWPNSLPENREEALKNAETEQRLGTVSKTTLAEELGRDYPSELAQLEAEQSRTIETSTATRLKLAEMGMFSNAPTFNTNGTVVPAMP